MLQHLIECRVDDARVWFVELQESRGQEVFVKTAVTLWAIWSARRKSIHKGIFRSPQSLFSFTTRFIGELESIKERKPVGISRTGGDMQRRTRPRAPPVNHAKLHVDGP